MHRCIQETGIHQTTVGNNACSSAETRSGSLRFTLPGASVTTSSGRKKASQPDRKVLGFSRAVDQPRDGAVSQNAKNRFQSLDGGFDDWTPLEKAYRLDADDRHIFDDRYAFSHHALYFAGQWRISGALAHPCGSAGCSAEFVGMKVSRSLLDLSLTQIFDLNLRSVKL